MSAAKWRRHRLANGVQTLLLVIAMAVTLGALGWTLAGSAGAWVALLSAVLVAVFNAGRSLGVLLRMRGAKPVPRAQAPELYRCFDRLAERAGLPAVPALYYIPSPVMNAFAVGRRSPLARSG